MAELRDLYQEVILEHSKAPRNYRGLRDANAQAEGYNPLCGDRFTVYLEMEGDRIHDIGFQGSGCAISKASASMMTEKMKGRTRAEALDLFQHFHRMVTGRPPEDASQDELGKLKVFAGVAEFPVRVKCATLPWHTLESALRGAKEEAVSTE